MRVPAARENRGNFNAHRLIVEIAIFVAAWPAGRAGRKARRDLLSSRGVPWHTKLIDIRQERDDARD
jgi:hypothetical protein